MSAGRMKHTGEARCRGGRKVPHPHWDPPHWDPPPLGPSQTGMPHTGTCCSLRGLHQRLQWVPQGEH